MVFWPYLRQILTYSHDLDTNCAYGGRRFFEIFLVKIKFANFSPGEKNIPQRHLADEFQNSGSATPSGMV